MSSPFNRSSLTSRSPTRRRQIDETSTSTQTVDAVSTPEIQEWLIKIEHCLSEICSISSEGKLNTDQKLKISNTSRNVMGGVAQMAVHYQSLKQKYISALATIQTLNAQKGISDHLDEQLIDLKECIKSAPKVSPSTVSFAEVVKKGNDTLIRPPSTSSIAFYPADKEKSSEETKKLIQAIIKPEELKLHIRGVRKTKNGGVIINAEGKVDLEKLKQSEQLKTSGLKFEETAKRRPKIIMLGVPANTPEKEVFECLYEQNISDKYPHIPRDRFLSSIKLSHKSGKKEASYCNFIIELPADLRKILIEQERVYINWTSCPVRDFTLVTRCYKCQQYGHSAKFCRDTELTCGHCGCVGHSIKECSKLQEQAKCATCRRFNKQSDHKTGDEQCPARKSAEARYLSSIDYEGA